MANTTIGERPEAKQLRAQIAAEQARRREQEAAVTAAHRAGGGPGFSPEAGESTKPTGYKVSVPG